MPTITHDTQAENEWTEKLILSYESEQREGVHVSDLLLCLRQPELMKEYPPSWDMITLFRFTVGRALEKAVFKLILPQSTRELEVSEGGIEGHIDFGGDPHDWECKLTWSKPPSEPEDLLDDKFWWFEQMATYAIMRRRTECKLAVLYLFPIPRLACYLVSWERDELGDMWRIMQSRMSYMIGKRDGVGYPKRTPHTWLCKGCPVEEICYNLPN